MPNAPENGVVSFTSGTRAADSDQTPLEGSVIIFSCDTNYELFAAGSDTATAAGWLKATAQPDGTWDIDPPRCEELKAPMPAPPTNGAVEFLTGPRSADECQTPLRGAEITYSCSDGFVLVGQATASAQADGTWAPAPPVCERVTLDITVRKKNWKCTNGAHSKTV